MGYIGEENTIRHLREQLADARKKSKNRRRAIKELTRVNQCQMSELSKAWVELSEYRLLLTNEVLELRIREK